MAKAKPKKKQPKASGPELFGHVAPAELAAPSTGNAEVDALVATRRRERWTNAGQAAFKRLLEDPQPSDEAALVALLREPAAVDFGVIPVWKDEFDRAAPTERRARQKALDLVFGPRTDREQYLAWLAAWSQNHAAARAQLRELLGAKGVSERAKAIIASQLLAEKNPHRTEDVAAIAALWERGVTELTLAPWVLMAAVALDLAGSFARFSPLLDAKPEQVPQFQIASALLGGLRPLASRLPEEWGERLARALEQEVLAIFVPPVLAGMPRNPKLLPALLKLLGRFVTPEGLMCIAQHGDRRATPLLTRQLGRDTPHWDTLLEACRAVGDPSLAPELKRWTEKQRTLGANGEWEGFVKVEKVIAELDPHSAMPTAPAPPRVSKIPRAALPRARIPAPSHRAFPSYKLQRLELIAQLEGQQLAGRAEALIRDAWVLRATRVSEDALPLGGTRLGGLPDLPRGTGWPAVGDRSLCFVAQLRLSEVKPASLLPKSGLLSFFVLDEWGDGESPGYLEKAVVLHTPDGTRLERLKLPRNFQSRRDETMEERRPFAACLVEWVRVARLPSASNQQAMAALSSDERVRYRRLELGSSPQNQLLGWRDRGWGLEGVELLLQVTSDDQAGMEWGDGDELDFCAPREALLKGDFSQVFPYCGD